jgi:hypothetical protein
MWSTQTTSSSPHTAILDAECWLEIQFVSASFLHYGQKCSHARSLKNPLKQQFVELFWKIPAMIYKLDCRKQFAWHDWCFAMIGSCAIWSGFFILKTKKTEKLKKKKKPKIKRKSGKKLQNV